MKKVLLLITSIFLLTQAVWAYQTVLINFPKSEGWHCVYYKKQRNGEAILQYVPKGETENKWTRTLVFHSYKISRWVQNAAGLMDRSTMQMENQNSSQLYKYLKYTAMDSIAVRCVRGNVNIPSQCEIYRTSKSFEGIISMHYINKDIQDYEKNYDKWLDIVKNITIYSSYYRTNRVLDKATSFEL